MFHTLFAIKQLSLHGLVGLQFKAAADGSFRLLEINARGQGSISTSTGAGVNLVELALDTAAGRPIPKELPAILWGHQIYTVLG